MSGADPSPTPEYIRDIRIIESEPWNERGPIDELIGLQAEAFKADKEGDLGRFGGAILAMSRMESLIGNHSEAAAYARQAGEAFVSSGNHDGEAVAAFATAAKEHRTLESPELALSSLEDMLVTRSGKLGLFDEGCESVPVEESIPLVRLVRSFTAAYCSS